LGDTVGAAIGLLLLEPTLSLGPESRGALQKVRTGQCYNIRIALSGLINEAAKESSKARNWAIIIADTVIVAAGGASPEVLTGGVGKALKDAAYHGVEMAAETHTVPIEHVIVKRKTTSALDRYTVVSVVVVAIIINIAWQIFWFLIEPKLQT